MILGLWKLLPLFVGELVQKAKRGSVANDAWHIGEKVDIDTRNVEQSGLCNTTSGGPGDNKIFS